MWPNNVRGFDWTAPPMAGPPAADRLVGYWSWCDVLDINQDDATDCRVDYYVCPDGSARAVYSRHHWLDAKPVVTPLTYPAGTWRVVYPTTCTFGSRGGIRIEPLCSDCMPGHAGTPIYAGDEWGGDDCRCHQCGAQIPVLLVPYDIRHRGGD